MTESEQQSKQKFIALMKNLIEYINQNPAHQLTIYECLNTQQIKRLFESLHDYSKILRLTAMLFISKLLYNSPHIVDTLLIRDNSDLTIKRNTPIGGSNVPVQKFLVTGLENYKLDPQSLAQIVILINSKVKYKKNTLFWYIDVEGKDIGYFGIENNLDDFNIDPQTHIIGIFVGDPQAGRQTPKIMTPASSTSLIRKNIPDQPKSKYTISKAGYFSIHRKN